MQYLAKFNAQGAQFDSRQRPAQVVAEYVCLAPAGRQETAEQTQQRRFAGAVVADDGDAFAMPDGEPFDVEQRSASGGAAHGLQRNGVGRIHASAIRIRRLRASNETTSAMTTSSTVDSRSH